MMISLARHYFEITFVAFVAIMFAGCNADKSEFFVKSGKGEIRILKENVFEVKYSGKTEVYKSVRSFIWFADAPYILLSNGNLMKWHQQVADLVFGMQKIGKKLYFMKQLGDSEWDGTMIYIIDEQGDVDKVKINKNPEFYGVFQDGFIVENLQKGFCVINKKGDVIKCYEWPE